MSDLQKALTTQEGPSHLPVYNGHPTRPPLPVKSADYWFQHARNHVDYTDAERWLYMENAVNHLEGALVASRETVSALLAAAKSALAFAEHELELRAPSGDPEYIAYAEQAVNDLRAAISRATGGEG